MRRGERPRVSPSPALRQTQVGFVGNPERLPRGLRTEILHRNERARICDSCPSWGQACLAGQQNLPRSWICNSNCPLTHWLNPALMKYPLSRVSSFFNSTREFHTLAIRAICNGGSSAGCVPRAEGSRWAGLRQAVRRVSYEPTGSAFEAKLLLYGLARKFRPKTYRKYLKLRPAGLRQGSARECLPSNLYHDTAHAAPGFVLRTFRHARSR